MKTLTLLTIAFVATSCHPLQTSDPAGSSQFGVINLFRGSPTAGDTDKTHEASALVRNDHEEMIQSRHQPVIETSSMSSK